MIDFAYIDFHVISTFLKNVSTVIILFLQIGTTAHEIGHVLGLFHEHTRPDRDRYVTVVTENIKPAYLAQFAIKQYSEARTYGIPYDYSSVMHYPTSVSKSLFI